MAASLSLTPTVSVFPCPNCRETINTTMAQCTFCGTAIDHAAAESSAAATSKISQAVSDASYLKIMAGMALLFVGLRFVLFLSFIGVFGFLFLEIAIPIMVIRWWIKFGSIKTDDADYRPAKKIVIAMSVGCALFFLARLVGIISIKPF